MLTDPVPPPPNQAFLDAEAKFEADNAAMIAQAAKVQADIAAEAADRSNYIKELGKLAGKSDIPPFALILLYMYALGASSSPATLEGGMNDQIGLAGDRTVLNSTATNVTNDLTDMINSNSSGIMNISPPNTAPVYASVENVFANDTAKFLGEIGGDPSNPNYCADLDPNSATPSMNPDAENLVEAQWLGIRRLFNIPTTGPWGPVTDPAYYNPQSGDTYYFDPGGGDYIGTFAEYQTDLNKRSGGGDKNATAAAKIITDNSQTASEALNTSNASLNNDIKTISALTQSINQALSAIAQMWTTLVKTANSHMVSGT